MFEIGFSEIVVFMLVALIIIGPEHMPKIASTLGNLWGRMQRNINQVKTEVTSGMELEELRKLERKAKGEADAFGTLGAADWQRYQSSASSIGERAGLVNKS